MVHTIAAVAAVVTLTLSAVPVYAQDAAPDPVTASGSAAPAQIAQAVSRPAALTVLYASYGVLQVYDVYSTKQGLARGAREANPLMQEIAGNTSAFIALKAGASVATIVAVERLWKTNKPAAIGAMIAANSVAAIVAARNARTLAKLR